MGLISCYTDASKEYVMIRHYYVSDDLEDLAKVEKELTSVGLTPPQIHVLSEQEADVQNHNLNQVESVLKQDVVHSTEIGAVFGIAGAMATLVIAYFMGWTASTVGWVPFIFLAIVVLGFCTWEGGFIGIQHTNVNFRQFQDALKKGQHVLFVDASPHQEASINKVVKTHRHLQTAGVGTATPYLVVRAQDMFRQFKKIMP
jgi:hypothetical protein